MIFPISIAGIVSLKHISSRAAVSSTVSSTEIKSSNACKKITNAGPSNKIKRVIYFVNHIFYSQSVDFPPTTPPP